MGELISANNLRGLVAEFIATFTFVFIGVGAVDAALALVTPIDGAGLIVIALGHGLGIFLGIVAIGRITGAHLNPAITIAMIVAGNTGLFRGFSYIVGQLACAVLAILTLDQYVGGLDGLGVQSLGVGVATVDGFVLEVILTFFLVFTVFATIVDKRGSATWAPLAIGMVIFVRNSTGWRPTGSEITIASWPVYATIANRGCMVSAA